MRCDDALALLWDRADGDAAALDPLARRALDEHLLSCAGCREREASIAETDVLLARSMAAAPPSGGDARLAEHVLLAAADSRNRGPAPFVWAALGLAATSVMAFQLLSRPESASFLERLRALPEVVAVPGLPPLPDIGVAARVAKAVGPLAARLQNAWPAALPARLSGASAAAVGGLLLLQLAGSARLLASRRWEIG